MVTPSARKSGVKHLTGNDLSSERRACKLTGVSRSSVRYHPHLKPDETWLREEIKDISRCHKRFGYRRTWALLRRKGKKINVKRVHRIWKAEGLSLPRKRPKRRRHGPRVELVYKAEHPNHVWSYDILEDRTERGGVLRILTVLDEYTRESLAIVVDRSIDSQKVIETLEWLYLTRGVPEHIRSDNGPEFTANGVEKWLKLSGGRTLFIEPGSPWENAYIESFNGKFRDECLNMEVFRNGKEAQMIIENWRTEYNECRPHSSLGYQTPVEFAAQAVDSSRATPSFRLQPNENKPTLTL